MEYDILFCFYTVVSTGLLVKKIKQIKKIGANDDVTTLKL